MWAMVGISKMGITWMATMVEWVYRSASQAALLIHMDAPAGCITDSSLESPTVIKLASQVNYSHLRSTCTGSHALQNLVEVIKVASYICETQGSS